MAWWKSWRGKKKHNALDGTSEEDEKKEEPYASPPKDEHVIWLETLREAVVGAKRLKDIGDRSFWEHLHAIHTRGDERLALQWVETFVGLAFCPAPAQEDLRVHLLNAFEERGSIASILPHVQALQESSKHACKAHFSMAEHWKREGDTQKSMRSYESVLAIDICFPNAKNRLDRLRVMHKQVHQIAGGETMMGASSHNREGNRYMLVRELGRGAAGVVYLAKDMQLQREVAVKLLHPHLAGNAQKQVVQSFFEEARVAASLRHPNIVAILDLDLASRRMVMELFAGGTLRAHLKEKGPLPLYAALEKHAQILAALEASHARGVVHRDVKPGNLMFRHPPQTRGAEMVLGDFGIAHLPDAKGNNVHERGVESQAVGTMAYMAPEQRQGAAVLQSDLFASGVVLFEMLTGRYPWPQAQLLAGHRSENDFCLPPTVELGNERLATLLQQHISALGHPNPTKRPSTVLLMKQARRLRDLAMLCKPL